ncbi:hypothetical protein [Spirosoma fluminis]
MIEIYTIRFYAYDTAECTTFQYLSADTKTSSLVGFTKGKTILLIEDRAGSIAKTYMIVNHPMHKQQPRVLPGHTQLIEVYVISEEHNHDPDTSPTEVANPMYGPSL